VINFNTNGLASGRLGFAIATAPGGNMGTGLRDLFKLSFVATVQQSVEAPLALTGTPVPLEVSDSLANPLSVNLASGSVRVVEPAGPALHIAITGNTVVVNWTIDSDGFELQASDSGTGESWTTVPGVVTVGDQRVAAFTAGGKERFFRLRKQ
jgi:hypothetical protein